MFNTGKFIFGNKVACVIALPRDESAPPFIGAYSLEGVVQLAYQDDLLGHPALDLPESMQGHDLIRDRDMRFIRRSMAIPDKRLVGYDGSPVSKWFITVGGTENVFTDAVTGQRRVELKYLFDRVSTAKVKERMTEQEWIHYLMYTATALEATMYSSDAMAVLESLGGVDYIVGRDLLDEQRQERRREVVKLIGELRRNRPNIEPVLNDSQSVIGYLAKGEWPIKQMIQAIRDYGKQQYGPNSPLADFKYRKSKNKFETAHFRLVPSLTKDQGSFLEVSDPGKGSFISTVIWMG